jgi:hypothetical protein
LGHEHKIAPYLQKELKRYIVWAMKDAGLNDRQHLPTIAVVKVPSSSNRTVSHAVETDEPDIETIILSRMNNLAAAHRRSLVHAGCEKMNEKDWIYRHKPPTIFAFAVVQHVIGIFSLDSSRPQAQVHIHCYVNMSEDGFALVNALSVALTVHIGREWLWKRRDEMPPAKRKNEVDVDV